MPRINLLPWRAELRQKRKKDFMTAVLAAALFGGLSVYATTRVMQGRIDGQIERNDILRAEIKTLDEQIAEIRNLQTQRDRLVARMEVIDNLQRSRPEIVHLFDELVNIVPDGTYLRTVKQQQQRIEVTGVAESNGRVSTMLRNIDESAWLKGYDLAKIDNAKQEARAQFSLSITQATTDEAKKAEEEKARRAEGARRSAK